MSIWKKLGGLFGGADDATPIARRRYSSKRTSSAAANHYGKLGKKMSGSSKQRGDREAQSSHLDACYVTDRLIACGFPWKNRTTVQAHRNNVDEFGEWLNKAHGNRYLVWNLSSDTDVLYFKYSYQAEEFDLSRHCSLDKLFRLCYAVHAWLRVHPDNVAVLHCRNGVGVTGLACAC